MSLLKPTNLVIEAAQLPADFSGEPQQFAEALIRRMSIKSTVGTNFFVMGEVEPSTDQGPWLKGGTQWYVFSASAGGYVPIDLSASTARLFTVSADEPDEPGEDDATIWLRTSAGRVIGWYFWNGDAWRPGGNVPPSGAMSSRPAVPQNLEQFFDTDINALIHWERGAWRTVSGTPGDVKFVTDLVLTAALTKNPGWEYLGESIEAVRGKAIATASADTGATPETSYATTSGITTRAAGSTSGAETHVLTSLEIEQHTHLIGGLASLDAMDGGNVYFYRVDDGEAFLAPTPRPPNYSFTRGDGAANGSIDGTLPSGGNGATLLTSKQLSLSDAASYTKPAVAHNNVPPTLYLWALTKR